MKTGKKSQFTGILLSLFLGPRGLFYSMSWKAATVLSLLGLLAYSFASELSLENVVIGVMQASSVILSILAVRTYNKRVESHATGILNAQALMEMEERVRVKEAKRRTEETEKARLDAERTRLAREKIGLKIQRERLRTEFEEPRRKQYSSNCTACGAPTLPEFREGFTLEVANCGYCGSPLTLQE